MIVSTITMKEREKASRSTPSDTHRAWHRLFGDDCGKRPCPLKGEGK